MSKPIKILSICTSDNSGGASKAAYRIHLATKSQGLYSRMLVKYKTVIDADIMEIQNFKPKNMLFDFYFYIQNKIQSRFQKYKWRKYIIKENVFMSDLRSTPIYNSLQKVDYDILHLHWINLHFLDLNELKKVNKPIIWTLHDCWPFTGVCHYFYNCNKYVNSCGSCHYLSSNDHNDLSYQIWIKKKEIYKKIKLHIVCPSSWLADAARKSSLFSNIPITVIPNSIDSNFYVPGNRKNACIALKLDINKNYILFSAMNAINDKRKGLQKLEEALLLITKEIDTSEYELLIVGADKPFETLELGINVKYLGQINSNSEMVLVYQSATITIVPSLSENLSNGIMESLSCGTPVIAFNIGGNSDLINHKVNGYLAESFNVEDLAMGISWCIKNYYKKNLSSNSRLKVLENYTLEKIGKEYKKLYQLVSQTY